ncbi:MAG TPA: hypothetical protein VNU94_03035, partial [Acidobacteriaceae bacterium]|nr:hypothetical protein [Acidobacteriaceae bacterium]
PRAMLPELMLLVGERYEYEMAVLAYICSEGERPLEVPIETIYKDGNRSSHFDPVRDSLRIYLILLRFFAPPSWRRALISPASASPSHSRTIL